MVVKVPLYKSSYVLNMDVTGIHTDIWGDYSTKYEELVHTLKILDVIKGSGIGELDYTKFLDFDFSELFALFYDLYYNGYGFWVYMSYVLQSPMEYLVLSYIFKFVVYFSMFIILVVSLLILIFWFMFYFIVGGRKEYSDWRKKHKLGYSILQKYLGYDNYLYLKKKVVLFEFYEFVEYIFLDYIFNRLNLGETKEAEDELILYYDLSKVGFVDYDYGVSLTNDCYTDFTFHSYKVDGYKLNEDEVEVDNSGYDDTGDEEEKKKPTIFDYLFYGKVYLEQYTKAEDITLKGLLKSTYESYRDRIISLFAGKKGYRVTVEEFRERTLFMKRGSCYIEQELLYKQGLVYVDGSYKQTIRYMPFHEIYYSGRSLLSLDLGLKSYYEVENVQLGYKGLGKILLSYFVFSLLLISMFFSFGLFFLTLFFLFLLYIIFSEISSMVVYSDEGIHSSFANILYHEGGTNKNVIGLSEGYHLSDSKEDNYYRDMLILGNSQGNYTKDFEVDNDLALNENILYSSPSYFSDFLLIFYNSNINTIYLKKLEYWVINFWKRELRLFVPFRNYRNGFELGKVFYFSELSSIIILLYLIMIFSSFYLLGGGLLYFVNNIVNGILEIFDFIYSIFETLVTLLQSEGGRSIPILEVRKVIIPRDYIDSLLIFLDFCCDYFISGLFLIVIMPQMILWFYIYMWLK